MPYKPRPNVSKPKQQRTTLINLLLDLIRNILMINKTPIKIRIRNKKMSGRRSLIRFIMIISPDCLTNF